MADINPEEDIHTDKAPGLAACLHSVACLHASNSFTNLPPLPRYHNRENVVVSALLAEGHPRAQTPPESLTPRLQPRSTTIPTEEILPPVDEASVLKLRNFFPSVDPELIRTLLRQ
ncbi:hypothetical protein LAZ67_22001038 [Cordylochernes scorpioides]|uniref:CUE domain-containing protein n=1 Tax=Cordylochernes scorpioides TaxID=51811 RepID=A0ABY6LNP9_9ARAC|nr:hypothetical protein LAZ67_22001038 [Cordylochernes scorpioides]